MVPGLPESAWSLTFALALLSGAQTCPTYDAPANGGNVQSKAVVEASGLAASRLNPGVLWTHNDSGGTNRVYAMGTNGIALGEFILSGASAADWEDIAVGPGPTPGVNYLYVGDIGDNFNFRSNIKVYRVPEPFVNVQKAGGTVSLGGMLTITLAYPDGPRDAETLMIDTNGDIYIVTKRVTAVGRVYRAAFPQATSGTVTLEYVASLPWGAANGNGGATGGDISADGSTIIVRRISSFTPSATMWKRPAGTNLWDVFSQPGCDIAMPKQPQGESICFSPLDLTMYSLSEGSNQPVWRLPQVKSPGDLNGDQVVNVADLLKVIGGWGACPTSPIIPLPCPSDTNNDGTVNVEDLLFLISHWGG